MEIRHTTNPADFKTFTTERMRKDFLIENLFQEERISMVYTHYDRMVIGGAVPVKEALELEAADTLKTEYFLERREVGFLNIGGDAVITADRESFELGRLDALYVGKGNKKVTISSKDASNPARVYFCSALAHAEIPTRKISIKEANPNHLGSLETSNERVLNQYIHADGIQSCQLMMGVTQLKTGSVWNTMPAHIHDRRMEAYLYFDLKEDARVFHMMGEPSETRHLVVSNEQGVISPSWSIHSGAGTSNYSFIWAMAGENYTFKDMDMVPMNELK
ncbi:5-dehydro-4-deoxy-D-glucuronate isomerase [Paenibacillus sp. UNC499MF]|uniref:5-dehydro-4-deoxy-D-glucuronate isomerase n=1 Tax=Paenibacillus sp. UNC499MF TaxID=1502751 RepID=UPI0008A02169|nr:5-dehydro-4-deoxy-D-glucuronate isomerase [Paenibacillus sp. UNC499MF]SEF94616.1 4-deoxy-L-threo-5-hexosulose-uronate ketol-isomerase [Paenibacillus sp. UNC499MF]